MQIYSAEEKRALAMINYEEKAEREKKVMADLAKLVKKRLAEDGNEPFAPDQES